MAGAGSKLNKTLTHGAAYLNMVAGMSQNRRSRRRGPTAAQRRAAEARAAEARAEQELRTESWRTLSNEIHAWRDLAGTDPQTQEELISPVMVDAIVTSAMGERRAPNAQATSNHPGADLRPADRSIQDVGIRAAMSGRVLFAGKFNSLLGEAIFVGADNGEIHVYGHLQDLDNDGVRNLEMGQRVHQGQQIGIMGRSGNTTGRCLHFVIRRAPQANETPEAYFQRVLESEDLGGIDMESAENVEAMVSAAMLQAEASQSRDRQLRNYHNYELVDAVVDGRRFAVNAFIPSHPAPVRTPDIQVAEAGLAEAGVREGHSVSQTVLNALRSVMTNFPLPIPHGGGSQSVGLDQR